MSRVFVFERREQTLVVSSLFIVLALITIVRLLFIIVVIVIIVFKTDFDGRFLFNLRFVWIAGRDGTRSKSKLWADRL